MAEQRLDLPNFENPPLIETALGVQFDPLPNLDVPRLGLLWQRFKETLPVVQQQPPLDPVIERAGARAQPARLTLQISQQPLLPRCWFLDDAGGQLLQVQQDRLIWNWRKTSDQDAYPRYDDWVRPRFIEQFDKFLSFLREEQVGDFRPNQCEVIYVNHIASGQGWTKHSDLDKVFVGWSSSYGRNVSLELETVQLACQHTINDDSGGFLGRLHVGIESVFRKADDHPLFVMTLTARGKPLSSDREGVLGFLDLGRHQIVKTFDAATTQLMHQIWRKRNG